MGALPKKRDERARVRAKRGRETETTGCFTLTDTYKNDITRRILGVIT